MTFPARVRVTSKSGAGLSADGAERGACGSSIGEQRAVVSARCAAVGAGAGLHA